MTRPSSLPTMYEDDEDSVGSAPPPPPVVENDADGVFDDETSAFSSIAQKMSSGRRKQLMTGFLVVLMVVVGALAINLGVNGGSSSQSTSGAVASKAVMPENANVPSAESNNGQEINDSNQLVSSTSQAVTDENVNTANQLSGTSGGDDDWTDDWDGGDKCVVKVTVDSNCYGRGDTVFVEFSTCGIGGGWVALYPASAEDSGSLSPNYMDWDWASGSGSTTFVINRSGVFKVFIMAGDDWDGGFIASTAPFRVSSECHSDGGMPAGHSYDKPVPAPTRPPACDDYSVDVEGCHEVGDHFDVSFALCAAGPGDWIGFFCLGSREYTHWEYTCGGQDEGCSAPSSGTLSILASRPCEYRAHLYNGKDKLLARSGVYRVAHDCYTDGGRPSGHSYPDKPVTPPSKPPAPKPTPRPTPKPTPRPTHGPTYEPTPRPTPKPTPRPTHGPTYEPTPRPTPKPTPRPTHGPTYEPTPRPTHYPTYQPTPKPTPSPTPRPTHGPTYEPTPRPTPSPTPQPTHGPTYEPTPPPTHGPTYEPTPEPSTVAPTPCVENPNQIDWCVSFFGPSETLPNPVDPGPQGYCNPCIGYVMEQYSLCGTQWDMWCHSTYMWCCPGAVEACPGVGVTNCFDASQMNGDCQQILQIARDNGDFDYQIPTAAEQPPRVDTDCPAWMTPDP